MIKLRAKVTGWTDGENADRFEDEYGCQWCYFGDDMHMVAVHRCNDDGTVNGDGAGYFEWEEGTEDAGHITQMDEGDTFGVNCTDEFVIRHGEWRDNDSPDGPTVDTEDNTYGIP